MTPEEIIAKGTRAAQLLHDPVFTESMAVLRAAYIKAWESADTLERRESMHARVTGLTDIEAALQKVVNTGIYEVRDVKKKEAAAAKPR